jgi:hypothetical protein
MPRWGGCVRVSCTDSDVQPSATCRIVHRTTRALCGLDPRGQYPVGCLGIRHEVAQASRYVTYMSSSYSLARSLHGTQGRPTLHGNHDPVALPHLPRPSSLLTSALNATLMSEFGDHHPFPINAGREYLTCGGEWATWRLERGVRMGSPQGPHERAVRHRRSDLPDDHIMMMF